MDAIHSKRRGRPCAHIPSIHRVLVGAWRARTNRPVDHVSDLFLPSRARRRLLYSVAQRKEVWIGRVRSSFHSFHLLRGRERESNYCCTVWCYFPSGCTFHHITTITNLASDLVLFGINIFNYFYLSTLSSHVT